MTRFARHERAQHADSQIDNFNLRIVLMSPRDNFQFVGIPWYSKSEHIF